MWADWAVLFAFFYIFILHHQTETWQQKHLSSAISFILPCMASVCRFGSCSPSKYFQNRKDRSWKYRSIVPEYLLGSRIKALEDDWIRKTVATSQAGVDPLYACIFHYLLTVVTVYGVAGLNWKIDEALDPSTRLFLRISSSHILGHYLSHITWMSNVILRHFSVIFHGVLVSSSLLGLQISSLSCRPCLWPPKSFHCLTT